MDRQSTFAEQLRIRFAQAMLGIMVVIVTGTAIYDFANNLIDASFYIQIVVLITAPVMFYLLEKRLYVREIQNVIVLLMAAAGYTSVSPITVITVGVLAMAASGMIANNNVFAITIAAFLLRFYVSVPESINQLMAENISVALTIPPAAVGLAMLIRYVNGGIERAALDSIKSSERLQVTNEVGRIASTMLDLDELLKTTVDLISESFGYYHVQVFMVDEERQYANLVASTGRVGRELLNRGHRLAVGSQSVIGRVTQLGDVVIARDTDAESVHSRNELLPSTRSELALPIIEGDRIIGALDVQSADINAFSPNAIQLLQVVAGQLTVAIRNARLFEMQAESVRENKRLFLESEASLREIQRLNRQLTHQVWENYQHGHSNGVVLTRQGEPAKPDWTQSMVTASQTRQPVVNGTIAVPLMLRGAVIGAIEVEPGKEGQNAAEIVEAVASRLAINLDNARLFEESQQATAQEQHINAIVGQYQSALSVEELLQITLTELSQSLDAPVGKIRLAQRGEEEAS
jgi:GAF domain-containing protein